MKKIIAEAIDDRFGYLYSEAMKSFDHNFKIGEAIKVEGDYRTWNFPTEEPSIPIPESYLVGQIYLINRMTLNPEWTSEGITKSGNWHVRFELKDRGQTLDNAGATITMTRLANNPVNGNEILENVRLDHLYSLRSNGFGIELYRMNGNVSFLSAEQAIGDIKVTVKNGPHNLDEGQDVANLKLLDYLDVSNAKGTVSASWVEKPDTSKVGEQKGKSKLLIQSLPERQSLMCHSMSNLVHYE